MNENIPNINRKCVKTEGVAGAGKTTAAIKAIEEYYLDKEAWARSCLINIAESGYFSSDRTIEEYNRDIWHLNKIPSEK